LLIEAYEKAHVDPARVGYIECHGTGTSLGDPIEIQALTKAFGELYKRNGKPADGAAHCGLSSAKTNIGHLETAAGIAGILRVLLAIKHRQIPANVHFEELNPYIKLSGTPFYIVDKTRDWAAPVSADGRATPRLAGVSSFGFGGANAHVVLEEYVPQPRSPAADAHGDPQLIVLSAKTPDRLHDYAASMAAALEKQGLDFEDFAYTLQVGRDEMAERLAFVARSPAEAAEKFARYLRGEVGSDLFTGSVRASKKGATPAVHAGASSASAEAGSLEALAVRWTQGGEIDWSGLSRRRAPRRLSLPTYPFARERCWIPEADSATAKKTPASANAPVESRHQAVLPSPAAAPPALGAIFAEADWHRVSARPENPAPRAWSRRLLISALDGIPPAELTATMPDCAVETLPATDDLDHASWYAQSAAFCFERVKSMLRDTPTGDVLVQIAVPQGGKQEALAGIAAMLKTARLENSRFSGQVILCPPDTTAKLLASFATAAVAGLPEATLRFDIDGSLWHRRWRRRPEAGSGKSVFNERGVYLITGGLGGLGLLFADEILGKTQHARVVLTGRGDPASLRSDGFDRLRAQHGGRVEYRRVDLGSRDDVSALVSDLVVHGGGLHGILHCAGGTADGLMTAKDSEAFMRVLEPKVAGTFHLDEATRDVELDFFALFSSVSAVFGNPGQSDYATANAYLDEYARHRNDLVGRGLRRGRTVSIAWPLWASGGMQPPEAVVRHLERTAGMLPLPTEAGVAAFKHCLEFGMVNALVLYGAVERLDASLGQGATERASAPPPAGAVRPSRPQGSVLDKQVRSEVLGILSEVLLLPAERIQHDALLNEYGLDSIGVANFVRIVNERYSLDLAPALLFEYPTYDTFCGHLLDAYRDRLADHHGGGAETTDDAEIAHPPIAIDDAAMASVASAGVRGTGSADVAIVGISATMPGADSAEAFWRNLIAGVDPITEVPAERWDWRGSGEGAPPRGVRWGGFLADVDKFDAGFFEIAPSEAALMDPQQRLFLQSAWNAIEDAGHRVADLAGTRTGVFVGLSGFDYSEVIRASGIGSVAQSATGMAHCLLPNRLSYLLDLRGPSEAIDTACSSSLVAVHRAVEAIAGGDCEMAIAGGVNLMLAPSLQSALGHAGMLAGDGRCKTFDRNADGYVRSEGCAAVLLKRLDRAVADGDEIYGVVKGSAVNHGGRAMGLTAPNPNAQAEVVAEAYRRAGVDAALVGLVETHGTGTPMGDAVELNGLRKAFGELASRAGGDAASAASRDCMVSSVKTSIGHLEAASGIASLIKVLLSIRHRTIPGLLHFTELSPQIRLDGTRFRIARDTRAWQAFEGPAGERLPLTAGVSSFGFGGVNAHVVVQEHAPVQHATGATADRGLSRLIVLSAKTREQLRQRAAALAGYIDADAVAEGVDLARIAYTLQTGRDGMAHRLGLRAASLEELSKALHAFAADGRVPAGGHCGEPERTSESMSSIDRDPQLKRMIVDKWLDNGDHGALLELWSRGVEIDWNGLYGDRRPRRVHLPGYPFARSRHWVDTFHASAAEVAPQAPASIDASPAARRPATPPVQTPATTPKALAVQFIRRALSQQLQVPPESLPLDRTLLEMGVVSSGIASLVRQVNTTLDLDLVPSLMFEHPTIDGFATHLSGIAAEALRRNAAPDEAAQPAVVAAEAVRQDADDQEVRHALQDRDLIDKVLWKHDANDEDYERVTF